MITRRQFVNRSLAVTTGVTLTGTIQASLKSKNLPVAVSTWDHGVPANKEAIKILLNGGTALDAVESGVRVPEADPDVMTVGYGSFPDRDGHITLDACIMDEKGNAGSVSFLQHIKHPVSVARKVMEDTPHVMLSGAGALKFALEKGFKKEELMTEKSTAAWKKWLVKSEYKPVINIENHDTISMLAVDKHGNLSGACTTSGMAFKMHGRVGDSPIIGAGLYCDNEVGGAAATGHGEYVMRTLGSFLVVELMRNGLSPMEACKEAVMRTVRTNKDLNRVQIGYIAVNKTGETAGFSLHEGFSFAHSDKEGTTLNKADSYLK